MNGVASAALVLLNCLLFMGVVAEIALLLGMLLP